MRIAVSASNPEISSPVDPSFGRCLYFIFVDLETMEFEAIENPFLDSSSGAGIQSSQFVVEKGAKAVLTGSCGPNAFQTLQAAGIKVIIGVTGTVQEAVEEYKSGQFQVTAQPNVPSHFGLGGNGTMKFAFGMGRGMGRGLGRGMGRGMGRGKGRAVEPGMGYGHASPASEASSSAPDMPQLSPEEEIRYLKQQADFLKQQMDDISKKIKELEKNKK